MLNTRQHLLLSSCSLSHTEVKRGVTSLMTYTRSWRCCRRRRHTKHVTMTSLQTTRSTQRPPRGLETTLCYIHRFLFHVDWAEVADSIHASTVGRWWVQTTSQTSSIPSCSPSVDRREFDWNIHNDVMITRDDVMITSWLKRVVWEVFGDHHPKLINRPQADVVWSNSGQSSI